MTRTGKIARLPREIRNQLNRRLRDGEPGCKLVEWLNSLPEVQAALQRDFKGRPVTEGNLSEWRKGGYCEWLAQQDALDNIGELSAVAGELASAAPAVLADRLNTLITIHYAGKLIALNSAPDKNLDPREMIECSRIAVELQRGLQNAERIKIEQQRLELDRTKTEKDIIEQLLPLIEYPKVRECIRDETITPHERRIRLKKILGIEPDPSMDPSADTEIGLNPTESD